MDDEEWAGWQRINARLTTATDHAERPCDDCLLGFAADMRAIGRCNGTPAGLVEDGQRPVTEVELVDKAERLAKATALWNAYMHLGSQAKAARELGVPDGSVTALLSVYMAAHGLSGLPYEHVPRQAQRLRAGQMPAADRPEEAARPSEPAASVGDPPGDPEPPAATGAEPPAQMVDIAPPGASYRIAVPKSAVQPRTGGNDTHGGLLPGPRDDITHYVGDDCPGGHLDEPGANPVLTAADLAPGGDVDSPVVPKMSADDNELLPGRVLSTVEGPSERPQADPLQSLSANGSDRQADSFAREPTEPAIALQPEAADATPVAIPGQETEQAAPGDGSSVPDQSPGWWKSAQRDQSRTVVSGRAQIIPETIPVAVHINDGGARGRAVAWSEGHTAGFQKGLASAKVALEKDLADAIRLSGHRRGWDEAMAFRDEQVAAEQPLATLEATATDIPAAKAYEHGYRVGWLVAAVQLIASYQSVTEPSASTMRRLGDIALQAMSAPDMPPWPGGGA